MLAFTNTTVAQAFRCTGLYLSDTSTHLNDGQEWKYALY